MAAWPWILAIDDIAGIFCIAFLFFMRRRLSPIFAVLLLCLLALTNILVFIGYHTWLILALPIIGIFALSLLGRPLVKPEQDKML
jgi:hypothetical protein